MRYLILTRKTKTEKSVLNPRTGNMITEFADGSIQLKKVNKLFIKRCIDNAMSGEDGWDLIFYDDVDVPYREKL